MRVLVTGAGGQLGRALGTAGPPGVELRMLDRSSLDIADPAAVADYCVAWRPEVILNAAAYTAVDLAESEPEAARLGNVTGPAALAGVAARTGARLVHVSTDFVFDGRASRPYAPGDPTDPLGEYGRSKLEGERAVLDALGERAIIVRTAWVYAASGRNFVTTMLRLMATRDEVRVVSDQVGSPTAAFSLAQVLWALAARPDVSGVFHWTDAGVASWYDFAVAIAEEGHAAGLLERPVRVVPIMTEDYPTPARRPSYSVLDCRGTVQATGIQPRHWRENLRTVLQETAGA